MRVCNGQGNPATLGLFESLSSSGLKFAGLADNEGESLQKWQDLKCALGDRLLQWEQGCTEQNVISAIPEEKLFELLKDEDGEVSGDRLRTLADRLNLEDKRFETIEQVLRSNDLTLRELIIAAAIGSREGAPEGSVKEWKKHGQRWFKSEGGGRELALKMVELGAWPTIHPLILPLLNAILESAGQPAREELEL